MAAEPLRGARYPTYHFLRMRRANKPRPGRAITLSAGRLISILLIALAVVLAGCGSSDYTNPPGWDNGNASQMWAQGSAPSFVEPTPNGGQVTISAGGVTSNLDTLIACGDDANGDFQLQAKSSNTTTSNAVTAIFPHTSPTKPSVTGTFNSRGFFLTSATGEIKADKKSGSFSGKDSVSQNDFTGTFTCPSGAAAS